MYDSTIGRWLGEDPLGFDAGAMNLAPYVGNGPTNATDPTGLIQWDTVRPDPKDPAKLIVTLDDGKTTIPITKDPAGEYQCHSLTFGGDVCKGGPYMVYGDSLGDIIAGDGYTHIPASQAKPGDIVVWRGGPFPKEDHGKVIHSGVLKDVRFDDAGRLDQDKSTVVQKPGLKPKETVPLQKAQEQYGGGYFVYRKGEAAPGAQPHPRSKNEWPVPAIHGPQAREGLEDIFPDVDPHFGKKK